MREEKGRKAILDVIDPDDIEWMRQQRNDPEMRQYFREWKDISKDQQAKWYASRGNNSDPNHVYFKIMVRNPKKSDEMKMVGCCGLHYVDWRMRSAEFGIFLSREARGFGIGKDALMMLFDYGFREMNLHKIWAEVYDFNKAMGLYINGLGMQIDGKLRHSQFVDGVYIDSALLSVLEEEWFKLHGTRGSTLQGLQ